MPATREVLTLNEAAQLVNKDPASLRQAIARGTLAGTMHGGVWHVSYQELQRYLGSRPTRVGHARSHWANRRLPKRPETVSTRDWEIFRTYVRHNRTTYAELAGRYGVSVERIRQICNQVHRTLCEP